ncbi:Extracellular calcium-sensing receptor [Larimichthys crocea]|uniref:Extracellular calcium-sensing receptor n=1 Tax=Larimichthys crocea TaxID=215358 RepID=A0A6G0IV43_LARCR|nr:Extracellular calcium-sensing receptor [Larimichthys crocea]
MTPTQKNLENGWALLQLLLVASFSQAEVPVCRLRGDPDNPELSKDGDIMLGGIFSFHNKWKDKQDIYMQIPLPLQCTRGFQFAQAMLFAIEEINNSTDLLPGISLGYKIYDVCASIARGVRVTLALANGNEVVSAPSEAPCARPAQVQAIIGGTFSSPCMAISTVIGPFHIPLISHYATCACLSDKTKYPSFLRTIPSDYHQSSALAQEFQFAQAMLFAIEEINNSTDLLPGISLGYKIYDICGSIARGVRVTLALANGNEMEFEPSEAPCTRSAQVQVIMGETSSSPSMAIATVIGPFYIPMAEEPVCRQRGDPENPQISKDGDIMLGGIFSFHSRWKDRQDTYMHKPLPLQCTSLNFRGFQFAQAMLFAIEEINNNTDLLPDMSLGYKMYDACGSIARGVRVALALANGNEDVSAPTEAPCTRPAQVQAIMGETSSSPCMAISTVIGPFHIPLISHFATCACLSDKTKYPSFLRTIPSDYYQSRALAQYRQTPIVRANNSELSFLLLFSLTLCFLCSLTFIGRPSEWSCMLRHTAFGITFVLCISCVLGKTIVVLMAFRATLPGLVRAPWETMKALNLLSNVP